MKDIGGDAISPEGLKKIAAIDLAYCVLYWSPQGVPPARLLQGIALTADEQRVLFLGERDYAVAYGTTPFEATASDWWQRAAARLDHYAAVREVLGADRFAVYLERASPDFGQMKEALGGSPPLATATLASRDT